MDLQRCWEPQSLVARSLCSAVTTQPAAGQSPRHKLTLDRPGDRTEPRGRSSDAKPPQSALTDKTRSVRLKMNEWGEITYGRCCWTLLPDVAGREEKTLRMFFPSGERKRGGCTTTHPVGDFRIRCQTIKKGKKRVNTQVCVFSELC